MARLKNEDGIREKTRVQDGIQHIHLEEYSGHWIVSPEYNRKKVKAWAKRNRDRLIFRADNNLAFYCKGFHAQDGLWVRRQMDKGHHYTALHLKNRQTYLDNYFCQTFGSQKPEGVSEPAVNGETETE